MAKRDTENRLWEERRTAAPATTGRLSRVPTAGCTWTATTSPRSRRLSIPCMVSQLTKALNQPVLVVSLGYMPKP